MRAALFPLVFIAVGSAWAQSAIDTVYKVEITASANPSISIFGRSRVPGTSNAPAFGYGMSLRAMWHPGRLLSVGILTGYSVLARDDIDAPTRSTHYSATLTAIPLQIALSMRSAGLEAGIGIGPYLMMSSIEGGGSPPAFGRRFEIAMTYFASYFFPLGDEFLFGPELRVATLSYRRIISIMPSVTLRYTPLRY